MSKILKMLNKKVRKDNKGFTLVELLVVIAIIGILAAVAVPSLFKSLEKGKVASIQTNISAIKSQILADYADDSSEAPKLDESVLSESVDGVTYLVETDGDLIVGGLNDVIKTPANLTKLMTETKAEEGATDGTIVIKLLDIGNGAEGVTE